MHNDHLYKIMSFFVFIFVVLAKEVERFRFGKGNVLMDEAQLQLAEDKDYSRDFEEDLFNAEHGDIYDEYLAKLPQFELHKLGKNLGWTQLPIVTRKKPLWSTPLSKTRPFNHHWARLYTKPPTVVSQKTTFPPTLSTTEAINKQKNKEKSQIINRGTIKTNLEKIKNETNLTTKITETIKINKEEEPTTLKTIISSIEKEEKENLIERLRKLIKQANLKGIFPSENRKVVVEVRSNVIAIKPSIEGDNSQNGMFALPRSWEIEEQNDSLAIQSWEKEHSRHAENSILSPPQNEFNERETSFTTQKFSTNTNLQFSTIKLSTTTTTKTSTTAKTFTPKKKSVIKPTFIHTEKHRHTGMFLKTLIKHVQHLTVEYWMQQKMENRVNIMTIVVRIASDNTCNCTYEVSGRDEEGCAIGFIYTCRRTQKSSNMI
ncbi:hypothetical protein Mgra_00008333 [Meloidogyne graminicola]|uniref:Uncharacterized protein n=1 Tax=Meloidogyne graminicola TaxID=189291 RepID=A0A8S9ZG22_9BILA|nr:hypothetical protein Mgra_00008333 [Meloidogyne graminicola]